MDLNNASSYGYLPGVVESLDKGDDINWRYFKNNWTPLMTAVHHGQLKVVTLLLERGANPNLTAVGSDTPLHHAGGKGYFDIAVALLDWGGDPNLTDMDGSTPLHNAAQYGHRNIVALLLDRGANPALKTRYGKRTAMDVAERSGHHGIVSDIVKSIPWQKFLAWQRVSNFVLFLHRGGYSSADWSFRLHVGGGQATISAAENSGTGSITTTATGDIGSIDLAVVDRRTTQRRQNRVLDNRDLCRIISSFIPADKNNRS